VRRLLVCVLLVCSVALAGCPKAPVVVTPPVTTGHSVSLTWSKVAGVTGYYAYRNGEKLSALLSATTFTDTTVVASETYTYYVTAYDGEESQPSNTVSATIP
jgi:fibronectin type 3 domain-containing protein